GHCAMGLRKLFKPLPDVPKTSPPPGTVTPATICPANIPAAGLEITISGTGFGTQGLWGISVNGVAATVLDEHRDPPAHVDVPARLQPAALDLRDQLD